MSQPAPLHLSAQPAVTPAHIEADYALPLLRITALQCRAGRRTELWQACRVLSPHGPVEPFAQILVATLSEALGREPVFYAPRTLQRSFDESWLLRLLERRMAGDTASVEHLIRARVQAQSQRYFRMLICGLADRISALH
ncbi:hypothetical protein SAMN06273572_105253 [Monaibacterium marinum]|uniref:Uncharacterized protein n=1 Tax=Pontivivens marinum TaxID=1690039 RepID=A0A2C9CU91_9RHOB|nr:hypothetical protein [Monaibacterium marinum]SOH94827.1 hypothetical protein SAMN06273572_105253 [Monaibacterium marinum]